MAQPAPRTGFSVDVSPTIPRELVTLRAADGVESWGVLYTPPRGEPRTAVHLMHPRLNFIRHYIIPGLVNAGYAVLAANSRYLNNDRDMVHERILLDVAAGLRLLRSRGYEGLALFGNSGGGSLLALYQAQAGTPPPGRLRDVPGDPGLDLGDADLPEAHAFISVASHRGQGMFLLDAIDPAVVDESDPLATDPALDMFHPDNGYRPPPEPSHYSTDFLALYREAQRARVARLDARARAWLAQQRAAQEAQREGGFTARPLPDQLAVRAAAALDRVLVVYRTLANPAFLDPRIDPSERPLGSVFAADPLLGNHVGGGLARVSTPRAWLSTWSGLSSRANLPRSLASVRVPTLVVNASGDSDIFPADAEAIHAASAAADKQFVALEQANHFLNPLSGSSLPDPRDRLLDVLVPWLRARLP